MSPFFRRSGAIWSVLENLPIGIYLLDREQRVRFWNRGAELITGYLAHEVTGQICGETLPHCDPQGRVLAGDHCSVTTTFRDGRAVQNHVFTLHKQGHRLGVQIRTLPLIDENGLTMGVAIAFEEAASGSPLERSESLLGGCLDPLTGVSSQRLTRAVLTESLAELEESHGGWGLLRIQILDLKQLSARYGTDSLAAVLRTSAQTIRHSLSPEDFLGRWEDDSFLAMLPTASPVKVAAIAELLAQQTNQSEISWGRPISSAGDSGVDRSRPWRHTGRATQSYEAHPCRGNRSRHQCRRCHGCRSFARISLLCLQSSALSWFLAASSPAI